MHLERELDPGAWQAELANADGYQLVVAGPGTGKTEFLVRRVARIIELEKASRDEVLVLTFSRRAARDIGNRIDLAAGGSTVPIESTTFHSLALRLLEALDPGHAPSPLTTPEQIGLVKELLETDQPLNWPVHYRGVLTATGFAEEVADFLMRCSERLLDPDDLERRAEERADWRGIPGFYRRYLQELQVRHRIDYGTLLVAAVRALETSSEAQRLAANYRYVLVDEYQDTSPAQAEMARLIGSHHGNLTVAGDPYQSIYSFRGAELRNISDFQESHDEVTRIMLDRSFRVPPEIMAAALRVVSGGDLPGAAGPVVPADHSGRVEAYVFDQETAEAEWIATQIERAIHVDGIAASDLAILVRSKREMLNEISRSLDRRRIPHNRPDRRLVDHPAVRMIADLATVASADATSAGSPSAAGESMRRILLGPLFGMGLGELRTLSARRSHSDDWTAAVSGVPGLEDLSRVISENEWATALPASDGFWHLWTTMPGFATLVADPTRGEWRQALSSFAQVLDRQAERDPGLSLGEFFELAADESFEATPLLSHRGNGDSVTLTTLHQAKGLEFAMVFIANAVEGVFPDLRRSRRMLRPELLSPERTVDPSAASQFQVQEEMRLAYTAMTRASRRVVWTATDAGVDQGEQRPSRFLLAASNARSFDEIGRPVQIEHDPVTIGEAQTFLRRLASDPAKPPQERLAAIANLAASPTGSWNAARFAGVTPPGPDSPILESLPALSPSQADLYNRCPRVYAVERRLGFRDPTSTHMQSGSLIHSALETTEREIVGTGMVHNTVEAALQSLRSEWANADFGTGPLNLAWLARAEKIVTTLYDKWPGDSGYPIELEKRVSLEVDGVMWHGVIDRLEEVDHGLRVVDYKTGTSVPLVDEAAASIQLGFYALALNAMEGQPNVVGAELWFPANRSVGLTTRSLKMDRLPEVEEAMRQMTAAIAAENWQPRVSGQCDRCAYKKSCPAWPEGRGAFL
jgi:superfamily I DNA/RNA helicase/RecB family exonuclease